MGLYRSSPQLNISIQQQKANKFQLTSCSVQGWPYFMQDFPFYFQYFSTQQSQSSQLIYIFGIFDGYCGPQVSQFCHNQTQFILKSCQLLKLQQYQASIQYLCSMLDQQLQQNLQKLNRIRLKYNLPLLIHIQQCHAGTFLGIGMVTKENLILGMIGECKAYIRYKNDKNKVIMVAGRHQVGLEQGKSNKLSEEKEKIQEYGNFIINNKINGKYHMKRSIGNLQMKNINQEDKGIIKSEPSVFSFSLEDIDMVLLGSGGVWENAENVVKTIFGNNKNKQNKQMKQTIKELLKNMIAKDVNQTQGKQNMSITVLKIK